MLARGGTDKGHRLLTEESVRRMTTNQLTPEQVATAGALLDGRGWGYGMSVADTGRYGWTGGYGTGWFNDPSHGVVAIVLTQCTDFLFNGAYREFEALVPTGPSSGSGSGSGPGSGLGSGLGDGQFAVGVEGDQP